MLVSKKKIIENIMVKKFFFIWSQTYAILRNFTFSTKISRKIFSKLFKIVGHVMCRKFFIRYVDEKCINNKNLKNLSQIDVLSSPKCSHISYAFHFKAVLILSKINSFACESGVKKKFVVRCIQVFWWFGVHSYGSFDIKIFWKILYFLALRTVC